MALITEMQHANNERQTIHNEVKAKYSVFEINSLLVLHIESYKNGDEKCEHGAKQIIQFNTSGIKQLEKIVSELEKKFGNEFSTVHSQENIGN